MLNIAKPNSVSTKENRGQMWREERERERERERESDKKENKNMLRAYSYFYNISICFSRKNVKINVEQLFFKWNIWMKNWRSLPESRSNRNWKQNKDFYSKGKKKNYFDVFILQFTTPA